MMPKLGNNLMGILKSRCTCDFIKGGSRQAHLGSTPQFLFIDTQQTHHKMGKSTKDLVDPPNLWITKCVCFILWRRMNTKNMN